MARAKKRLPSKWRPFEEARIFAHNLGLKSKFEWAIWAKTDDKPDDIPANPRFYKDQGWAGWAAWSKTKARPNDIPANPSSVYQDSGVAIENRGGRLSARWQP